MIILLFVAGCTVGLPSTSSTTPTPSPTPIPVVTTAPPTEQTKILVFESDSPESAAMQAVITKLTQKYDVTIYNFTANPGYIPLAQFEYTMTETPTIVVLCKIDPFESLYLANIVGVHSDDEVSNTIEDY
jgi:hypothetical protein